MQLTYQLQIRSERHDEISALLGTEPSRPGEVAWRLELVENEDDPSIPFVDRFLDLLEGKYDALEALGVQRQDISLWLFYEYEGQCNMEFTPQEMERLGSQGLTLCVSCWQA